MSAFDGNTLRIMAYNFKNDLNYSKAADLTLSVDASVFNSDKVSVTVYTVDDNCNYFDEWQQDRVTYNIGDDCFGWSPDDPQIGSTVTLKDSAARELYITELYDKYEKCAQLIPVTYTADVVDGKIVLDTTLAPNAVVFFEVSAAE